MRSVLGTAPGHDLGFKARMAILLLADFWLLLGGLVVFIGMVVGSVLAKIYPLGMKWMVVQTMRPGNGSDVFMPSLIEEVSS